MVADRVEDPEVFQGRIRHPAFFYPDNTSIKFTFLSKEKGNGNFFGSKLCPDPGCCLYDRVIKLH